MKQKSTTSMQDFLAKAQSRGIKVQISSDDADKLFTAAQTEKRPLRRDKPRAVKLFTHNDTDGVSCGILARMAFGDTVHIDYSNYDDINNKVSRFLDFHLSKYDLVFITDISVNEEVADVIEKMSAYAREKVMLLDHHQTAEGLNQYEWAQVTVEQNGVRESGTTLFYRHLITEGWLADSPELARYVEMVRQYDTWDWKENNNLHAKQLNDLFYILGRDRFVARFTADCSPDFTDSEQMLLEIEQEKIEKYIKGKSKDVQIRDVNGYTAGVVFAEQYISELGNALAEANPEVDFVAIINMSRVISYRTVKDEINVGDIAAFFGGGGHAKAAGSPVSKEMKQAAASLLFEQIQSQK
ncbi:DHH family phosphoesterase [Aneurinibacillus uraniidurans]|uniref:DHH family phosphoesterase n=1 Tax=Aneurinibacillus uraniidurans TaxID=2966586 RepID=UPI00234A82FC|nr:DHHA1 domain-containing protein [Aneurinibacillus sp. B1]WCN38267.1 DHHA1 domain-containing protein [Aneurinibacillus sp. B1]